jgi:hypothetical protein
MNKHTKIYYNGKRINGKWQMFVYKVKRFFVWCFVLSTITAITWFVFWLGGVLNPQTIITKAEVIKEIETLPPVLKRIAQCESGGKHFGKNGQVLVRANVSKTHNSVDIGKYQVNSLYWGDKATELGLNLWQEEDNEKMALWIYQNSSTDAWSASKKCWQ